MISRGLGAVLVLLAALMAGRRLARPYRQRIEGLAEWMAFLDRIKVELTFRRRPFVQAFQAAARGDELLAAVDALAQSLSTSGSLEDAVGAAVSQDARLGGEERAVIQALIPPLASAPAEWQNQALATGGRELSKIMDGIREECTKKARMLETLSTLAGLAAVVILL